MPEDEILALKPKAVRACCLCDAPDSEVLLERNGIPVRRGRRSDTFRVLSLRMLSGSFSDHTLCAECDPQPFHLKTIWKRACMLYIEQRGSATDAHLEEFIQNIPVGIIEVRPDDRVPLRLQDGVLV